MAESSFEGPHPDDDADTSPESAAVARGAVRTAAASSAAGRSGAAVATTARGAMAGRLPQTVTTSTTRASGAMARGPKIPPTRAPMTPRAVPRSAPRPLPKMKAPRPSSGSVPRARVPRSASSAPKIASKIPKARANTIAKATDRASKGFDVLSAGLEQDESFGLNGAKKRTLAKSSSPAMKFITQGMQQIASFGKIFVTNTVLGMAVFATYEGIVEHVASDSANNAIIEEAAKDDTHCNEIPVSNATSDGIDGEKDDNSAIEGHSADAMDRTALPVHFLAGAMGGAAHAVLSLALEVKLNAASENAVEGANYTFANVLQRRRPMKIQFPTVHYSTSFIFHHSLAHSVLFGTYQLTKRTLLQYSPFDTVSYDSPSGASECGHVASITIAGGVAGQLQHVTSRLTEQWLGLEGEPTRSSSMLLRRMKGSTWPTWRSTLWAFPPSAVGFLAFEYGKLMISGDDGG